MGAEKAVSEKEKAINDGGIKMTNQEINIAIAEEFGWSLEKTEQGGEIIYPNGFVSDEFTPFSWALEKFCNTIPNYCNDLNAMHVAEKVLLSEVGNLAPYAKCLAYATCASGEPRYHATASQRAEAFLRTIGKWEESK